MHWLNRKGDPVEPFLIQTVNQMMATRDTLPKNSKPAYLVLGTAGRRVLSHLPLAGLAQGAFQLPAIVVRQVP